MAIIDESSGERKNNYWNQQATLIASSCLSKSLKKQKITKSSSIKFEQERDLACHFQEKGDVKRLWHSVMVTSA